MCDFVHNKIPFLFSPFNIMIFARNVAQPTAIFDILYLYICWWWFHIPVCHLRCSFDQYQWSICWHCLLFNTRGRSQRPVPSTSSIETGTVDAWNDNGLTQGLHSEVLRFFLCLTHFRPHWNDSVRYLRNAYICHFWHHFFFCSVYSRCLWIFLRFSFVPFIFLYSLPDLLCVSRCVLAAKQFVANFWTTLLSHFRSRYESVHVLDSHAHCTPVWSETRTQNNFMCQLTRKLMRRTRRSG